MTRVLFIYLFNILGISCLMSQDLLTLEDAIKLGLEKNYAVIIQKNTQEIVKSQNNFGNAGMSPQVSLNGNVNLAMANSHQEFSSGVIQDRTGAQSNNVGASINVSWVVFDGLKMFAIKKRLGQAEELSALQLKLQMENTVFEIIQAYYSIVKVNEQIKAAEQNLSIYEERKKIAKLKLEIGSDSKVDYLLSQSDENKAKSSILQLQLQLLAARTKLNLLISKPVDTEFKIADTMVVNYNPNIDELKKSVISANSSILISKQQELISEQFIKEARSANLPIVQLNGAYNFIRNQSQAGFVFLNRQTGLNGGLTASWLLFNGNKNNRLIKEKNLLYLNQKYNTEQTQLFVDADVFNNYRVFQLNKQIVDLEKQNLLDSKEVVNVSVERYKIGKTNLLETMETQKNLEDAQVRYIEALYSMKIAEASLLKANGTLIK